MQLNLFPLDGDRDTSRDAWSTPEAEYKRITEDWQVFPVIDVCAESHNTKCPVFITKEMDALQIDWVEFAKSKGLPAIFWMNCPYSQPTVYHFHHKAWDTMKAGGIILGLDPSSTDTRWFQEFIRPLRRTGKGDYDFPAGRIKFIPPPGVEPSSPSIGNMEVCWGRSMPDSVIYQRR